MVVDRIVVRADIEARLADSLETALGLWGGLVVIDVIDQEELLFSENLACPDCGFSVDELAPRMFSFNSPFGACPECYGLGVRMEIDLELVINDGLVHSGRRYPALGRSNSRLAALSCWRRFARH